MFKLKVLKASAMKSCAVSQLNNWAEQLAVHGFVGCALTALRHMLGYANVGSTGIRDAPKVLTLGGYVGVAMVIDGSSFVLHHES